MDGIAIVRTLRELEPLENEWNALADQHQNPLLRHEWFACCARAFSADGDLSVVTVRRSQRLVGVAPLTLRSARGGQRLELLGMAVLNEPSGFLAADEQALSSLVNAVVELRAPLMLQRMADDSPIPELLGKTLPWTSTLVTRPTAGCLSVPIDGSWSDYYQTLSSRITGNLRRVKARSKASISVLTPDEKEVSNLLDQIMQVEGSGWKGRRGSAMACNRPLRAFFEDYAVRAARDGILRVALLRFDETVAAVELAVVAYRRWWQLKIGYAQEFARHYPGLQLTEGTLRYAFDNDLDSFEFLGSPASWETNWRPETRAKCTAAVYPWTVAGLRALTADTWLMVSNRVAALTSKQAS